MKKDYLKDILKNISIVCGFKEPLPSKLTYYKDKDGRYHYCAYYDEIFLYDDLLLFDVDEYEKFNSIFVDVGDIDDNSEIDSFYNIYTDIEEITSDNVKGCLDIVFKNNTKIEEIKSVSEIKIINDNKVYRLNEKTSLASMAMSVYNKKAILIEEEEAPKEDQKEEEKIPVQSVIVLFIDVREPSVSLVDYIKNLFIELKGSLDSNIINNSKYIICFKDYSVSDFQGNLALTTSYNRFYGPSAYENTSGLFQDGGFTGEVKLSESDSLDSIGFDGNNIAIGINEDSGNRSLSKILDSNIKGKYTLYLYSQTSDNVTLSNNEVEIIKLNLKAKAPEIGGLSKKINSELDSYYNKFTEELQKDEKAALENFLSKKYLTVEDEVANPFIINLLSTYIKKKTDVDFIVKSEQKAKSSTRKPDISKGSKIDPAGMNSLKTFLNANDIKGGSKDGIITSAKVVTGLQYIDPLEMDKKPEEQRASSTPNKDDITSEKERAFRRYCLKNGLLKSSNLKEIISMASGDNS